MKQTTRCPSCSAELPEEARYCSSCGTSISSVSQAPTEFVGRTAGRLYSSDSIDPGQFVPGTVIAARYRIVGLLGRGGMGEIYRADDLKLGQPIALKFLPKSLAGDPARLARFHAEVRLARQVSHPNVCRVYDIEEADGQPFLTMEYVDGEDLAFLLKRIGRPSRWDRMPADALYFWYRQSPRSLAPERFLDTRVDEEDPPSEVSGMATVRLDPSGRLVGFLAVPPQVESDEAPLAPGDGVVEPPSRGELERPSGRSGRPRRLRLGRRAPPRRRGGPRPPVVARGPPPGPARPPTA